MAHFSVKHRRPFKKSFCPSRRHSRQTASRCLAKCFSFFLLQGLTPLFSNSVDVGAKAPTPYTSNPRCRAEGPGVAPKPQTRRRFGGRQPLCGTGVTSLMALMCSPDEASARTADSRPAPGPFTRTSTDFIPYWSRATPAAVAAACCAAYGVPLRDPLKPTEPAEDQLTARPSGSVKVMMVLLNVA